MPTVPTLGEEFSKLIHHLGEAQSAAAMIGHLHSAQDSTEEKVLGNAWITVSELIKQMSHRVTTLATRGLQ